MGKESGGDDTPVGLPGRHPLDHDVGGGEGIAHADKGHETCGELRCAGLFLAISEFADDLTIDDQLISVEGAIGPKAVGAGLIDADVATDDGVFIFLLGPWRDGFQGAGCALGLAELGDVDVACVVIKLAGMDGIPDDADASGGLAGLADGFRGEFGCRSCGDG